VAQPGCLGPAGLDAVAQLTGFGEVTQELGPAAPSLGFRLLL
jgi:hypothetical protein